LCFSSNLNNIIFYLLNSGESNMRATRATPAVAFVLVAAALGSLGQAQDNIKLAGTVFIPASSQRQPEPLLAGFEGSVREYTNVAVFVPAVPIEPPTAAAAQRLRNFIETPASIACIYSLVPKSDGCDPNRVRTNFSGGAKAVAIVDAYDAPNIVNDLKTFSDRFNLASPNLTVVFADGTRPTVDKGWELETSLDVEWAHAMAPNAKIILVEATNSQYGSLLAAVDKATQLLAAEGGGQISLSWGGSEFPAETANDALHFAGQGVVYFAATGDVPGVSYPSTSPMVVAVGGTTIVRDQNGNFLGEKPWSSAGGGPSGFERRPSYQNPLISIVGNLRGVADLAAVADPTTGVWIYDSGNPNVASNNGWLVIGGTSAATPIVAAITNAADRFAASSTLQLSFSYNNANKFNQILLGPCGPGGVYTSTTGWSYCTGLGSPNGTGGL
jgi:subtilase family serine protease